MKTVLREATRYAASAMTLGIKVFGVHYVIGECGAAA